MKNNLNNKLNIGNIAFIAVFAVLFPVLSFAAEYDSPQAKDTAELQE